MEAARQLAQLLGGAGQLVGGDLEQLGGRGRVGLQLRAHQLQLERERDEPLLRAVVEVALDARRSA